VNEDFYGSISAPSQNRFLGGMANFMKFLEQEKPEFLPSQLDVMGLMRQLALPSSQTLENLSYGNSPFTMPPQGTGAMIPQVKTGRKPEVADLIGMISGVPGGKAVIDSGTKISQDALNAYMKMIRETPPIGAVNPSAAMPQIPQPQKSDLGFYSQLEAATIPLQNKGTGTQFLAQIEKTPGVKPEEIKFTGLDEFLRNRETVTKPEIQQFLDQNRVNLQEVRLGGELPVGWNVQQNPRTGLFDAIDPQGNVMGVGQNRAEAIADAAGEIVSSGMPTTAPTKFSSYTLPGGENYREILLTLPSGSTNTQFSKIASDYAKEFGISENIAKMELRAHISNPSETPIPAKYEQLLASSGSANQFKSSHFDQPNILAHMRVNDRVVDGKKTLFIEEIQSDWHQAGRKKGYADKDKPWEVFDPVTANIVGRYASEAEAAAAKSEINKAGKMFVDIGKSEGVPDAPFKTSWHELSLKRAIQEASEKGYDKIAFTTGQTQAARYDLSKQVSELTVTKETRKAWPFEDYVTEYKVEAIDVNGKPAIFTTTKENDLDSIVGKEIATKAINDLKDKQKTTYSGLDLQVGGEGMKGFYDNILPKSLEKLGKKFDAKVTKSTVEAGNLSTGRKQEEVWVMDITPKMRESVTTKGQPLFQVAPAIPAGGLLGQDEE
jgi:hypothetical protein